jgi:hypothetical protein
LPVQSLLATEALPDGCYVNAIPQWRGPVADSHSVNCNANQVPVRRRLRPTSPDSGLEFTGALQGIMVGSGLNSPPVGDSKVLVSDRTGYGLRVTAGLGPVGIAFGYLRVTIRNRSPVERRVSDSQELVQVSYVRYPQLTCRILLDTVTNRT